MDTYNEQVVIAYDPYERTFDIYNEPEFYIPAKGEKKIKDLGWKMNKKPVYKGNIELAIGFTAQYFKGT